MKVLVLGAGINGLISAYFYDGTIIAPLLSLPKGPVYLYKSPETKKFLEELDIYRTEKEIKIGFLDESGWVSDKISKREWNNYEIKTKRARSRPEKFRYYNFDWKEMIIKLSRYADMVQDEIHRVDPVEMKVYGEKGKYKYDLLVSTIPATIFSELVGERFELEGTPIHFRTWRLESKHYLSYDYIYDINPSSDRLRITPYHYCQIEEHLGRPSHAYKIIGGKPLEYDNVKYIGRLAKWDRNSFISDEIKLLYREVEKC